MAAKILQTGGIPEELTPPSVAPLLFFLLLLLSHPPLQHSTLCVFLRGNGGGDIVEEEEFDGTHSLQHTATNKRQMSVTQLLTNDAV